MDSGKFPFSSLNGNFCAIFGNVGAQDAGQPKLPASTANFPDTQRHLDSALAAFENIEACNRHKKFMKPTSPLGKNRGGGSSLSGGRASVLPHLQASMRTCICRFRSFFSSTCGSSPRITSFERSVRQPVCRTHYRIFTIPVAGHLGPVPAPAPALLDHPAVALEFGKLYPGNGAPGFGKAAVYRPGW